jgi:uncharacterized membrane protein
MKRSKCSGDTSVTAIASAVGVGGVAHQRPRRSRIWFCQAKIYGMNFSRHALKTIRSKAVSVALGVCLIALNSQPAFPGPFIQDYLAGDPHSAYTAAVRAQADYDAAFLNLIEDPNSGFFYVTHHTIIFGFEKRTVFELYFQPTRAIDPLIATVNALRADGSIMPFAASETLAVAGMTEIEGSIPITQDGQTFQIRPRRAFRWTITKGVQDLGILPTFDHSVATAISTDGDTVVGQVSRQINSANYTNLGYAQHAFRWTQALGMQDLGPTTSTASGVSGDGSVVIGQLANNAAFRWNLNNAATGAGVLTTLSAVPATAAARAIAISSDGSTIVGDSAAGGLGMPTLPIRWVAGGPPQSIGVPAGMVSATAAAVSRDGSVIVGVAGATIGTYSYSPATGFTVHDTESAFRWTQPTGSQTLNAVATAGGIDMTGRSYLSAISVTGDGQFMGGANVVPVEVAPGITTPVQSGYTLRVCDTTTSAACAATDAASGPVTVVEFYNASLDHYFITYVADEIAKLDNGTFKGWARTGLSFKAYASTQSGTSAVCRIYIPPGKGDGHFFGRDSKECDGTISKNPSFILESANFLYLYPPTLGTCAAGQVPVYRVFSNRADANHRYTTDRAVRDQMVAKGWLAEGDGSDTVVMCAPA